MSEKNLAGTLSLSPSRPAVKDLRRPGSGGSPLPGDPYWVSLRPLERLRLQRRSRPRGLGQRRNERRVEKRVCRPDLTWPASIQPIPHARPMNMGPPRVLRGDRVSIGIDAVGGLSTRCTAVACHASSNASLPEPLGPIPRAAGVVSARANLGRQADHHHATHRPKPLIAVGHGSTRLLCSE